MATHRFERVPSVMPARRPAWDTSWQGDPPAMMSTGSTAVQSTAVTSPRFGTPGKRSARILEGAGSNSATHAVSASNTSCTASASPP